MKLKKYDVRKTQTNLTMSTKIITAAAAARTEIMITFLPISIIKMFW